MASKLEKQGSKWTFRYYENGKQVRKTVEAFSYKEAQKVQLKFLNAAIVNCEKIKDISFDDFAKQYMSYSSVHNRPRTISQNITIIKNFSKFLQIQNIAIISQINCKIIEEYKIYRLKSVSQSSVNRELKCIKAIFTKALQWDYLLKDPLRTVKNFKTILKSPRFLSQQESEILIHQTNDDFYRTMIIIALYTGFRLAEIAALQWSDVDFVSEIISCNPKHGFTPKSNEFRTIPLNEHLRDYLLLKQAKPDDYIIPQKLHTNTLSHKLSAIIRQAKIKDATFHTLRHTFASRLIIAGVSLFTVSNLLGHANIKTTMIYAHLSKEHLKNSVDMLNYKI
jgi:site-specific recombinase XerD